ncbi:MAG: DUF3788 family protein [Phycisphaerae bacterium]|nr:DUF3788 family protein [Phycisphaerae bacterium]
MENPCLNDPEAYPDEEVLRRALGRAKPAWDAFQGFIADRHPSLSGQWRYYRDGKSWLYKLTNKKQTVCWISVYPNAFKTAFYFPDRAEPFITASALDRAYVDQFVHGKRYGRIRGITVQIEKTADLKAAKTLIEIKEKVR